MPESDKLKSLLYILTGALFVLVLLDKSTGGVSPSGPQAEGTPSSFFSHFKTIGKNSPLPPNTQTPGKQSHEQVMDQAEDEILSELLQNGDQPSDDISQGDPSDPDELFIPVVENPKESRPNIGGVSRLNHSPGEVKLYYLKFFGKGNKSHSRLVEVKRKHTQGDKVLFILKELTKGPSAEEKTQGVLNALPSKMDYSKEYAVENGILKLSLGPEFEAGAGPELLKDRVDEICYSLLENLDLKGIRLYINGKQVRSLGGVGLPIPEVLTKNPRKIAVL
ncbi:spore gernimation protein [Leptospira langatensis]|uniref:Spore gernimation protein n=1 Tax=Leptospira langatensis TaxID=2484983 RepID=A0A5F1ZYS3_9LEPT|nr:GerMN domain-containing protein [Leptospira langatensis]TGJ98289.1 spore gernimation protein [Leptospira langatensis]TGL43203.1 spore gernimation protein [Leptospira langatensis]